MLRTLTLCGGLLCFAMLLLAQPIGARQQTDEAQTWQQLYEEGERLFFDGKFEAAIAAWDKEIALEPTRDPHHWQRGLALYYAGRFEEGAKQFERHQEVNGTDVENAAWHFLCLSRHKDPDTAAEALYPFAGDRRKPMKEIHALFAGTGSEAEIIEACGEDRNALCYGHLYLGIHHEAHGRDKEARSHFKLAAINHSMDHYMGRVAKLHYGLRKASRKRSERKPKRSPKPLLPSQIKRTIRTLEPLHETLGEPKTGHWLATHEEPGQTYAQYLRSRPNKLARIRKTLYVQPIGEFDETQQKLVATSAEFLGIYFNCPITVLETKAETEIPAAAQREHPTWGVHQLLTSYILEKVLAPELPDDAFATIAFTTSDLWPGEGWNFVFGYAALRERVGVWSLARFGDPNESEDAWKQCLSRTLKVATHETGHMFSILHCTQYRCNMQGSNSLEESDTQPLFLCPECHAKILYATGANPIERYEKLIAFCQQHGLADEEKFFQEARDLLTKAGFK